MNKQKRQEKRKKRVRSKIFGTNKRPRLSLHRSNKYIYAQLVDDDLGKTLLTADDREVSNKKGKLAKITKVDRAKLAGELLAKKAIKKKISSVVFDRGGYRYHGRVKALADGMRKGGVKF